MNFHEVRFPVAVSFGSSGGPERRTEIVSLSNGFEERNTPWQHSRRRYDAGVGVRSLDALAGVVAFFEARAGQLYGFRWKDWTDFASCPPSGAVSALDQEIGVGDGAAVQFQLVKAYASGAQAYLRPVTKPVAGTVVVAVGGAPVAAAVDHASGRVTLGVAPGMGVRVTAGFEFDVPVRFDADRIATSLAGFQAGEIPAIPVVEVRV